VSSDVYTNFLWPTCSLVPPSGNTDLILLPTILAKMVAVQALFVYPIKGCQGIPLKSAAVTPTGVVVVRSRHCPTPPDSRPPPPRTTGLPYDRQWMVVREATGKFVTQRQIPKLCKVSVSLPPEALLGQSWGELQPGAAMVLSAPGMPQLQVPLTDPSASTANNTRYIRPGHRNARLHTFGRTAAHTAPTRTSYCCCRRSVTVWEWSGTAVDEGDEAAAWFSKYLDTPVRLVRWGAGLGCGAGRRKALVRQPQQLAYWVRQARSRPIHLPQQQHAT
jgi:uncharacterized protein YcbX